MDRCSLLGTVESLPDITSVDPVPCLANYYTLNG